ncbi:phage replisome organizer N-terminal domain-containing protein [Halarcobacter sp.]|uniref:phage replisome organizer N-terminal domain-containing protein n=1 Tax=Halarcobacter sp. TaxID=2321133 RepID=UPI002AAA7C9E|nr:phage replisome organizer N-terminal domain-containing protein [Halarcobacter sp.]
MSTKKYYWLKLKETFFSDLRIKKLRKMAGGDTYTIIFQKIMLLSLKDNGLIKFQNIEQNLQKELSLILDEDEDNLVVTLGFLTQTNILQKKDENTFYIPLVAELTGAETEFARKKREYRKRQKEDNVLPMSDKRKEIEKRRDREDIQEDIKKLSNFSSLSANDMANIDIKKLDVCQVTMNYLKKHSLLEVVNHAENHQDYLLKEISCIKA